MGAKIFCIFPISWRHNRTGGKSNQMIDKRRTKKKLSRLNVQILTAIQDNKIELIEILIEKKRYFKRLLITRFDENNETP